MAASEGTRKLGVHGMSVSEPKNKYFFFFRSSPSPVWLQSGYIIQKLLRTISLFSLYKIMIEILILNLFDSFLFHLKDLCAINNLIIKSNIIYHLGIQKKKKKKQGKKKGKKKQTHFVFFFLFIIFIYELSLILHFNSYFLLNVMPL